MVVTALLTSDLLDCRCRENANAARDWEVFAWTYRESPIDCGAGGVCRICVHLMFSSHDVEQFADLDDYIEVSWGLRTG